MFLVYFGANQKEFEKVFDNLTFKRMDALREMIQSFVDYVPNQRPADMLSQKKSVHVSRRLHGDRGGGGVYWKHVIFRRVFMSAVVV